jgi:hypothetical protein
MKFKNLIIFLLLFNFIFESSLSANAQTTSSTPKTTNLAKFLCKVSEEYDPEQLAEAINRVFSLTDGKELENTFLSTTKICPQNSFVFDAATEVIANEIRQAERELEVLDLKLLFKRMLNGN